MPPRSDYEKPKSNSNKNVDDKKKETAVINYPKSNGVDDKTKRTKLLRNNDLLAQSSTETLLDMLKANTGIKECSDETVTHINGVSIIDFGSLGVVLGSLGEKGVVS